MKNKEKNKKNVNIFGIIKIVFLIIAVILLIIGVSILYKANKYPDKVPDIFGIKPFIVLSGSMETEIFTGDLVFVKEIDASTIKEKDVIAFRNDENTVTTHRVVEIVKKDGQTLFRTKGDANNAEDDSLVSFDKVEGIYVSKIAKVGNMLMFLQQPMGLIVILLVILVAGMLWLRFTDKRDMKNLIKEDEQYKKEFEEFKKKKEHEVEK